MSRGTVRASSSIAAKGMSSIVDRDDGVACYIPRPPKIIYVEVEVQVRLAA